MPPKKSAEPQPTTLRRHLVRAINVGFANNHYFNPIEREADQEPFDLVIDSAITPPAWIEVLDDGEPVKERPVLNAARVAGEEVKPRRTGFAASVPSGSGEVI